MNIIPNKQILIDGKIAEDIREMPIYELEGDEVKQTGQVIKIVYWNIMIEN